ncbi:hypothetical protein ACH4MN_21865 [Streptomyces anulatus]|uniref:hypothetical protein n=1 Tax=Streptomyces sp. 404i TaxID=2824902 RepID=UPI0035A87B08
MRERIHIRGPGTPDSATVQPQSAVRGASGRRPAAVVERTFGWLMHHRRLARDYEALPHRSEAMVHLAMIDILSRRLTREPTPSRRHA